MFIVFWHKFRHQFGVPIHARVTWFSGVHPPRSQGSPLPTTLAPGSVKVWGYGSRNRTAQDKGRDDGVTDDSVVCSVGVRHEFTFVVPTPFSTRESSKTGNRPFLRKGLQKEYRGIRFWLSDTGEDQCPFRHFHKGKSRRSVWVRGINILNLLYHGTTKIEVVRTT